MLKFMKGYMLYIKFFDKREPKDGFLFSKMKRKKFLSVVFTNMYRLIKLQSPSKQISEAEGDVTMTKNRKLKTGRRTGVKEIRRSNRYRDQEQIREGESERGDR